MELAEGRSLASLLSAGPLPTPLALALAVDLAAGLGAAHAEGIVHRDLKKENIVITASGRPKILDFGLAKELGASDDASISRDGQVIGTPRAMSPEQARGEEIDARADLFALGSLLYEMLTGVVPFDAASAAESMEKVVHHEPPAPSQLVKIPRPVNALVQRLLEKSPSSRPPSAAKVQAELRQLLIDMTGDDDISSLAAMSHQIGSHGRQGGWRGLVAGGLLAALALLLAWWQPWRVRPVKVAVGSFETLGSSERHFFADGLPEAIVAALRRLEGLDVSLVADAGQVPGDASYLISGSVQWSTSELVSVRPRIVRAADRTLVWQDHFRLSPDAISNLRSRVAEAITRELERELGLGPQSQAETGRAGERFRLDGQIALTVSDSESSAERALFFLRRATEMEPGAADFHAELAEALVASRLSGLLLYPSSLSEAREAASRALALEVESARARLAKGGVLMALGDFDSSLEAFEIAGAAADLSIESTLHRYTGWALWRLDDRAKARNHLLLAQQSPPRPLDLEALAMLEADMGYSQSASEHLARGLEFEPGHARLRRAAARVQWLRSGSPTAALEEFLDQRQGGQVGQDAAARAMGLEGRDASFAAFVALADRRPELALEMLPSASSMAYFYDRLVARDLLRAWAFEQLGRPTGPAFDSARRALEAAVALSGDARAMAALAMAHLGLGDGAAAQQTIELAIEGASGDAVLERAVAVEACHIFEQLAAAERAAVSCDLAQSSGAEMGAVVSSQPPWSAGVNRKR